MFPDFSRPKAPSQSISEWTPRSFLSPRKWRMASGMVPMPSWMQAPSSIRLAQLRPICSSISPTGRMGRRKRGSSHSTARSMSSMWTRVSP